MWAPHAPGRARGRSTDRETGAPPGVIDPPRAGLPADRGLSSLGLVMQLAGRGSAGLTVLVASLMVSADVLRPVVHHHAGWLALALAASLTRSHLHRRAGRDLVYAEPRAEVARRPLGAMRSYVGFALGHAVAIGLGGMLAIGATCTTAIGVAIALALWPAVLGIVAWSPLARRFARAVPEAEDRGLEGASLVMTVLGLCGALSAGAILAALGALPGRYLQHGWRPLLVVVLGVLLVRSALHLRAGLSGLCETSFDRPSELTRDYARFGVLSACAIGGVLALLAMAERSGLPAMLGVAVIGWLLMAWPLDVRRYFQSRQFAELLAGARAIHRRAPDAGLSGLGWLLAGHATSVAALVIVAATTEPHGPGRLIVRVLGLTGPALGRSTAELALSAGIAVLEALAAAALIGVPVLARRRRSIASAYALTAGAVALAAAWPLLGALDPRHGSLRGMIVWVPAAIQLALPAATLILNRRTSLPSARARYRSRARRTPPEVHAGRCHDQMSRS